MTDAPYPNPAAASLRALSACWSESEFIGGAEDHAVNSGQ
jgi:hypothetical protein